MSRLQIKSSRPFIKLNIASMEDWSNIEVNLIVADYFSMLVDEIVGKPVNKTAHRKALQGIMPGRSKGSIEFKHQNISAILVKMGLPYIRGYKPRFNFQKLLEDTIISYIHSHKNILEFQFQQFSESATIGRIPNDFDRLITDPPERSVVNDPVENYITRPFKINYLEREQRNSSLGNAGEKLALEFEKWRLKNTGLEYLAEKVEWISAHDDAAGFDILSHNENGTDRYIEVKTTKLSKDTPIFFSEMEYQFSLKKNQNFNLYRIFDFSEKPRLFMLNGSFDDFCFKNPVQYRGEF